MPPLPAILDNYIIKTDEKINKFNVKVYCKPCIKILGETEGHKCYFPNKKDRIIAHFKKCAHFATETTPEEREKIYNLVEVNTAVVQLGKRKGKYCNK